MSELDSAFARLSAALDGLDNAVQKRLTLESQVRSQAEAVNREVQALREDRGKLKAELERLGAERDQLEGLTVEVSGRLDHAIYELRAVLGA